MLRAIEYDRDIDERLKSGLSVTPFKISVCLFLLARIMIGILMWFFVWVCAFLLDRIRNKMSEGRKENGFR